MTVVVSIVISLICVTLGCVVVTTVNLYVSKLAFTTLRQHIEQVAHRLGSAIWRIVLALNRPRELKPVVPTLRRLLDGVKRLIVLRKQPPAPSTVAGLYHPVDLSILNGRVRTGREIFDDAWRQVLLFDLCGTIEAPNDDCEVRLEITLVDGEESQSVMTRSKQGSAQEGCPFVYYTEMGRLCHRTTVLEDWTMVARICPESFVLPRQGHRNLQCNIAVFAKTAKRPLAVATCTILYDNTEIGYLDIEDNIQRAKTLAVGLAFSVGATDNDLLDVEVAVIDNWVQTNFHSEGASAGARSELKHALRKTAAFFRRGGRLNVEQLCREITQIAPMIGRLDTLDLCLRVAAAKGRVCETETTLIKNLADWLEIDRAKLRAMVEKTLPVGMHESQDNEMILGITDEMNKDQTRRQLNREYAKWSSRVISSDPAIRKQADQMLQLIATARTQFVGLKPSK
jgi:uncharacterized tellurite resistance protein B-like protein